MPRACRDSRSYRVDYERRLVSYSWTRGLLCDF